MNHLYRTEKDDGTCILALRPVTLGVDELPVNAHLVNLLETETVVPQVGLAEAPPMREYLL